jgi:hypothetical protein
VSHVVWKVPFEGRIESFRVVKWAKREAYLRDWKGEVRRITPSDFHFYVGSKEEAIKRGRAYAKRRVESAQRDLASFTKVLALLDVAEKFTSEHGIQDQGALA